MFIVYTLLSWHPSLQLRGALNSKIKTYNMAHSRQHLDQLLDRGNCGCCCITVVTWVRSDLVKQPSPIAVLQFIDFVICTPASNGHSACLTRLVPSPSKNHTTL